MTRLGLPTHLRRWISKLFWKTTGRDTGRKVNRDVDSARVKDRGPTYPSSGRITERLTLTNQLSIILRVDVQTCGPHTGYRTQSTRPFNSAHVPPISPHENSGCSHSQLFRHNVSSSWPVSIFVLFSETSKASSRLFLYQGTLTRFDSVPRIRNYEV